MALGSMYITMPTSQYNAKYGKQPDWGGSTQPNTVSNLLSSFQQKEEAARTANLKRYEDIMKIYDKIIAQSQPGGAFEKRALADIERQKTKTVGKETQQLISSGLYGTTTMAGVGRRFEAEVGQPARLTLEDLQQQRLSSAMTAKAGFMERREDEYPDYGLIAQLAAQAANRPNYSTQGYGWGS